MAKKDEQLAEKSSSETSDTTAKAAVALVKMTRVDGQPTTADVHPDEVDNYARYGWRRA